jgi:hypothetical protein
MEFHGIAAIESLPFEFFDIDGGMPCVIPSMQVNGTP